MSQTHVDQLNGNPGYYRLAIDEYILPHRPDDPLVIDEIVYVNDFVSQENGVSTPLACRNAWFGGGSFVVLDLPEDSVFAPVVSPILPLSSTSTEPTPLIVEERTALDE